MKKLLVFFSVVLGLGLNAQSQIVSDVLTLDNKKDSTIYVKHYIKLFELQDSVDVSDFKLLDESIVVEKPIDFNFKPRYFYVIRPKYETDEYLEKLFDRCKFYFPNSYLVAQIINN
jgi:hypothetical protein